MAVAAAGSDIHIKPQQEMTRYPISRWYSRRLLASGVVQADGIHVRVLGVFRNVLPKDVALRSWGYCLELGLKKGRGPGPAYEL